MIDHSKVVERHDCDPPEILRFDFDDKVRVFTPTVTVLHPEGTWFTCDACGRRWVVWRAPDQYVWRAPEQYGRCGFIVGGLKWRPESRWERWTRRWRR